MKTFLLSFTAAVFFSFTALANNGLTYSPDTECRKFVAGNTTGMAIEKLVWSDLASAMWEQQLPNGGQRHYQFDANGELLVFDMGTEGSGNEQVAAWWVEGQKGVAILKIQDEATGTVTAFTVKQTCEGVELAASEGQRSLVYRGHAPAARIEAMKADLAGDWTDISMGLSPTPIQSIKFKADGSFVSTGGEALRGRWEFSRDGRHLVLRPATKKLRSSLIVFNVKQLDSHELILNTPGRNTQAVAFIK